MKYEAFKERVLLHLGSYKKNTLGVFECGLWPGNGKEYPHILPKHLRHLNFLPTVEKPLNLKEHRFSHHLNSSQIMCVNFFEPLLHTTEGNTLLLQLLEDETGFAFSPDSVFANTEFEFEPCKAEGTNFDFYIELLGGTRIFFEIKYTEQAFGGLHHDKNDPEKYDRKWREIYTSHLRNSLYLRDFSACQFYEHYQIWRNISYVRKNTDYVVFLIPFENDSLRIGLQSALDSVDKKLRNNITGIDWHSIVQKSLELSRNSEYYGHYNLFAEKYLNFAGK